jgi:putative ABC transport system substrate-binding protein
VNRKIFALTLGTLLFALGFPAQAQQPAKVYRIGYLGAGDPASMGEAAEAFRQGLKDIGYIEGKTFTIEHRYAEGKFDRLSEHAREFVRTKVDVIIAPSTPSAVAAKTATKEIPIVFHTTGDPVERGIVATLARPGGNITGITMGGAELYGKRLELLKEILPKLSRAAFGVESGEFSR